MTDLSSRIAQSLKCQTDQLGSTLFSLTWKEHITPAGRRIFRLAASGPRTEGSVFIGWPTPDGQAFNVGANPEKHQARLDRLKEKHGNGNGAGTTLGLASALAGWPTTRAEDAESSGMRHSRGVADTMTAVASLTSEQAKLSGWATTTAGDSKGRGYTYNGGDKENGISLSLIGQAQLTAFGESPIGYLLGPNGWEIRPASGQLSAAHSRWLMGLPPVWDDSGVTAMASVRRLRKRS